MHTKPCVCVCSVAQICLTLCDFMDCSLPGSSVHGIFSARILEWVALHSSRGIFPTLGSNPHFLHYRFLTTEPMGRPYKTIYAYKIWISNGGLGNISIFTDCCKFSLNYPVALSGKPEIQLAKKRKGWTGLCVCMCMWVCVCVCEREREGVRGVGSCC